MMSPVVAQTLPALVCSDECANPGAVRIQTWGNIVDGPLTHSQLTGGMQFLQGYSTQALIEQDEGEYK